MRFAVGLLAGMALCGQPLPTGFVRGFVTENLPGEFRVRTAPESVFRFHADARTWIEREQQRISPSALLPGELLEVVSDRDPTERFPVHYARMVTVIAKVTARPPVRNGLYRLYKPDSNTINAAGINLTYAGIVIELKGEKMVLRTRLDGDKTIYLGADTRCLNGGLEVEPAAIRANIRVFVQAGRNINNELEALQIVWGPILEPAGLRD
jgi:hypothetical protein